MAGTNEERTESRSLEEQLREADRHLAELQAILTNMDEISILRRRRGEAASDDFNGFKRSDVIGLIEQQQKRRKAILAELEEKKEQPAKEGAPKERTSLSAALEKLYENVSADVGHARRDILQELKYNSRQTISVYDDLVVQLGSLADRIAERLAAHIDYGELADRIVSKMTEYSDAAAVAKLGRRIEALETALGVRAPETEQEDAEEPAHTAQEALSSLLGDMPAAPAADTAALPQEGESVLPGEEPAAGEEDAAAFAEGMPEEGAAELPAEEEAVPAEAAAEVSAQGSAPAVDPDGQAEAAAPESAPQEADEAAKETGSVSREAAEQAQAADAGRSAEGAESPETASAEDVGEEAPAAAQAEGR